MDALVSIIIPTFNKSQLAIETFKSIINQSYKNWECIIVDDGSLKKDFKNISVFVQSDKRFSLYKRPKYKQKGANACRNYGLSISKGKYIQFFDSDDLMLEDCLLGRVKAIQELNLDLIVFSMGIFQKDGFREDDTPDIIIEGWESALDAFIGKNRLPWNLQRTLYSRSLIKDKLIFNEDLSRFQDVEFNISLLSRLKPKFKILSKIDCVYRRAGSQNPRSSDFTRNVFLSIPVFLKSIHQEIPEKILEKNKYNIQYWLYGLIGLYANKSIKISDFNQLMEGVSGVLSLNLQQKIILRLLFLNKTKLKWTKGTVLMNKYLKVNHNEKNYKDNKGAD